MNKFTSRSIKSVCTSLKLPSELEGLRNSPSNDLPFLYFERGCAARIKKLCEIHPFEKGSLDISYGQALRFDKLFQIYYYDHFERHNCFSFHHLFDLNRHPCDIINPKQTEASLHLVFYNISSGNFLPQRIV